MYMFRLPMFRAMGRLPVFQKLDPANPFAALGLLGDPKALIDIFAGISEAIPDGTLLMNYGTMLAQAGGTPRPSRCSAARWRRRRSPTTARRACST